MRKKSKTSFKIIIAITTLLITMFSTISFATGNLSTLDITPPRGKIAFKNSTQIDNITYVDSVNATFEVSAIDDMCDPTEIKYYYSLSPISNTAEITTWYDYTPGKTHDITLTNPSGTNTIYAVFKDNVGNTSLIYGDTGYTIQYNKNADDAVMFTSTVATTGYYGMGFMVTMQTPTREGYYFAGWSTSPDATEVNFKKGEIIPADTFVGGGKEINLYAVWAQSTEGAVLLADVVEVGDYVNYPVTYDNLLSARYNGWRVISKNVDLDGVDSPGTVNLVSAGVPLTFYHPYLYNASSISITALTTNFLTTELNDTGNYTYRKTGFLYNTLTEIFTNKFTAMKEDGVTPKVRSMVQEDIFRVTGHTAMATGTTMKLSDAKWEQLFALGGSATYWLASANSSSSLWSVNGDGSVGSSLNVEDGVRPVVSLKSTVIATGQDAVGAWNIEVAG